jgi:hypothetical protein
MRSQQLSVWIIFLGLIGADINMRTYCILFYGRCGRRMISSDVQLGIFGLLYQLFLQKKKTEKDDL